MATMPIIVSHYTVGTGYEQEVCNLRESLLALGLDHDIEPVASLGSWRANSNYCAAQVRKMLDKWSPRPVLRVDADAVFRSRPDIFVSPGFDGVDVAACIWDNSRLRPAGELLGGTLYFANSPAARRLVAEWVAECTRKPTQRNGDLLQDILGRHKDDIVFRRLPLAYCKIFDRMPGDIVPVIEHFQASRRLKRQVNAGGGR